MDQPVRAVEGVLSRADPGRQPDGPGGIDAASMPEVHLHPPPVTR